MSRDQAAPDEELMLAYRDGDVNAFENLYRRHKAPLYRFLLRQCRDSAAAEELFQDIWTSVIRARAKYAVAARFTTYLYRLAHNRLIDHYRRRLPAALVSFDEDDGFVENTDAPASMQPEVQYEARAKVARLLAVINGLPAAQREALILQHETGMSVEEIAAVMGVTRETAKSRLRYAMAKLREGMDGWL